MNPTTTDIATLRVPEILVEKLLTCGPPAGAGAGPVFTSCCSITFMSSFIPPKQYNGIPEMKYLLPVEVSLTVVLPSVPVSIALVVEQLVYPSLLTSLTL